MTKKELEQMRSLRQELSTLEEKYLNMPYQEQEADTAGDYTTGQKRTIVIRGMTSRRHDELGAKIKNKADTLTKRIAQLEDYLDDEEDPEMRDILRLYYAEGMSQEDIGKRKGYNRSTISKKIEKYFEKNQLSHKSPKNRVNMKL